MPVPTRVVSIHRSSKMTVNSSPSCSPKKSTLQPKMSSTSQGRLAGMPAAMAAIHSELTSLVMRAVSLRRIRFTSLLSLRTVTESPIRVTTT